jgi:hypothetical protein
MSIKLKGSTAGSVALDAPANTSPSGSDISFTLPIADGSSGQVLTTNGSGAFSFADKGTILQIKQTHLTTSSSQSLSQLTVAELSGLSVSITPISSTSDMLIFVRWNGEHSLGSNYNFIFGVRRDSTDLGNPSASGSRNVGQAIISMGYGGSDGSSTPDSCYYSFLDTARSSGTSQITYKATVKTNDAGTLYNQRTASNLDTGDYELLTSNIVVMEVAA